MEKEDKKYKGIASQFRKELGGKIHEIPGASHNLLFMQPERLSKKLKELIQYKMKSKYCSSLKTGCQK